jgi:hypothetical protein
MHVPQPCSANWSKMLPISDREKYCSNCQKQVIDFTRSTKIEFDLAYQEHGVNLCGRFVANESGTIQFQSSKSLQRWRMVFLLVLCLNFQNSLFSNLPPQWPPLEKTEVQHIAPTAEMATLYGILKVGKRRIDDADLTIMINDNFVIPVTTDKRGRFSFELKSNLIIEKIAIQFDQKQTKIFEINESASEASKRIYRVNYKQSYRFVGCPAF